MWYRLGGAEIGHISNNGADDQTMDASIADRQEWSLPKLQLRVVKDGALPSVRSS